MKIANSNNNFRHLFQLFFFVWITVRRHENRHKNRTRVYTRRTGPYTDVNGYGSRLCWRLEVGRFVRFIRFITLLLFKFIKYSYTWMKRSDFDWSCFVMFLDLAEHPLIVVLSDMYFKYTQISVCFYTSNNSTKI